MATTHTIVPLHLSGNTTEQQNKLLQECLGEAMSRALTVRPLSNLTGKVRRLFLKAPGKLKSRGQRGVIRNHPQPYSEP
jgi:hypothetical protein